MFSSGVEVSDGGNVADTADLGPRAGDVLVSEGSECAAIIESVVATLRSKLDTA